MGRSKLTEENKKEILQLSKNGYTQAALAAKYEVSSRTIHRVLNPKYYARELARSTEYQRENSDKIRERRSKTRRDYFLSYNVESDAAVINRLDQEENVQDYIRTLVIDDIKKTDTTE